MSARRDGLRSLKVDDICHGECPNGASLICLVTAVTDRLIQTRTVTSQYEFDFNRDTGVAEVSDEKTPCVINSIAPLPADTHQIMLGLDRKFRVVIDWEKPNDWEKVKLTKDEIRGLIFVAKFYAENQLSLE